jgi:hypothetical protein
MDACVGELVSVVAPMVVPASRPLPVNT